MNLQRRPGKSDGFITTMALMTVALVAAAIFAATALAAGDFRRTAREARDAQLRQLLLAATIDIRAGLRAGESIDRQLQIPASLMSAGASASTKAHSSDGQARATIAAHLAGQSLSQVVTFAREHDFRATEVRLDE